MLDRTRFGPKPSRRAGRAPLGYEAYNVDWDSLTPAQIKIVCVFAHALREIRQNELALLRMSTVDLIRAMCDALRELNAEMRAERLFHDP